MAKKSPAFQFYPKDYLTDENVLLMNHQERGIYIDLICHCWLNKSLPLDFEKLAEMVKIDPRDFKIAWDRIIKKCFKRRRGRLINMRLSRERRKQREYSIAMSNNGKKSHAVQSVQKSVKHNVEFDEHSGAKKSISKQATDEKAIKKGVQVEPKSVKHNIELVKHFGTKSGTVDEAAAEPNGPSSSSSSFATTLLKDPPLNPPAGDLTIQVVAPANGSEPRPYKIDTPLKKVVCAWKELTGYKRDDRSWDKLNWGRTARTAANLLEFFENDWRKVIDCCEYLVNQWNAKSLTFTIETVAKHSPEWRLKNNGQVKN